MEHRRRRDQQSPSVTPAWIWLLRLVVLVVAVVGFLSATWMLYLRWQDAQGGGIVVFGDASPELNAAERLLLRTYLSAKTEELSSPLGEGNQTVSFVVTPGEHADEIAANLVTAGLLADTQLFTRYLRYHGLDSHLEAGTYRLSQQLTLPQLAATLTKAVGQEIELRFIEGWRLGEMADYLRATQPARIDPETFFALAERRTPFDLGEYAFLTALPAGATLEGYLFPDTYRLPIEATSEDLVITMLDNFGVRVTPSMRQSFGVQGLSVHAAVTLASIVEREAVVASERPLVASVFLNRLQEGMRLEADPTVQYALGFQQDTGRWWKSPLFQSDLDLDSPYNTYLYAGLPPGPIANPGLASLQAVADPEVTDYLFFVVDCNAEVPGAHAFTTSFEEHLSNVQRCR